MALKLTAKVNGLGKILNKNAKILIACEESGIVTQAFRDIGFANAYSCDLLPTSGRHPDWHIQGDVAPLLEEHWDLIIAFPPCTHLAVSGSKWFEEKRKDGRQQQGIDFFMQFVNAKCSRIAIENPVGIMSTLYRKPDQIIQPYEYGHPESKKTCLWLKGLPLLKPTEYAKFKKYRCKCGNTFPAEYGKYGCCVSVAKPLWDNQTKSGQNKLPPSVDRAKLRAKTYPGIAKAFATQYISFIKSKMSVKEWNLIGCLHKNNDDRNLDEDACPYCGGICHFA